MGLFALVEFPTLIVLGALGLTVGFFLWRSQRCLAAQPRGGPPMDRAAPVPSDQGVQMPETTHGLSGRLDAKIDALEQLVGEADRVAARLETALQSARPLAENSPGPLAEPDPFPVRPSNQAEALTSVSRGNQDAAQGGVRWEEAARQRPPADQRYEEVYRLSDHGLDTTEIARRVGTPEGEVELILGLRRKR
ncbi:MAG: hypothetical protein HQ582_01260 [Planctomycetes bacterium]|nr:hypothetical protein [Planctomycetota bacterium]